MHHYVNLFLLSLIVMLRAFQFGLVLTKQSISLHLFRQPNRVTSLPKATQRLITGGWGLLVATLPDLAGPEIEPGFFSCQKR